MLVYIDDFNLIRIESTAYIDQVILKENKVTYDRTEGHFQYFKTSHPIQLQRDDFIIVNGQSYPLYIGNITLTKTFEETYRYDGPLGAIYRKNETNVYLFSPVLKEAYVVIDQQKYQMEYQMPVWHVNLKGDFKGKAYHFLVRLTDQFKKVKDPYAMASNLEESIIIDFNDTYQMNYPSIVHKNKLKSIIYEGHIRDLSHTLDVPSKDTYLGLTEVSSKLKMSVLSYIKNLGMTHLQLLPVLDFEGVYDSNKEAAYNWGYNPSQFFVLEGWYSKDSNDYLARINEFKMLVDHAHQMGLGINLDVVYNHVYQYRTFPYDDLVPGYFYRHDRHHKMTDSSYCGNDIETRNYMVRRLIIDSLVYLATTYHIDGFRFDLMGLMDIETMLQIERVLRKINPNIMLYGEGWDMASVLKSHERASMKQHKKIPYYSHFNDLYRNALKGDLSNKIKGFVMGNHDQITLVARLMKETVLFDDPRKSIIYVECHDNMTLIDQMRALGIYDQRELEDRANLALHMIAISQGIAFYHAGSEHFRSKKGVENSYQSPDEINQISYEYLENTKKLQEILRVRKRYVVYQNQVTKKIKFKVMDGLIVYTLSGKTYELIHYIKSDYRKQEIPLKYGKVIFKSKEIIETNESMTLESVGVYIVYLKKGR